MKNFKFLFIGLLLMTYTLGKAQLDTASLLIGGSVGFNITTVQNDDNVFTFNFNPRLAVFINNNIAVGGGIGYTYQKNGDFTFNDLNIQPLVRYYIPSGNNEKVAFYAEGRAGVAITSFGFDGNRNTDTAFTFALGPGVAYFISPDVSIDTGVTYSWTGGDMDFSRILFNVGIQVWVPNKKDN